MPKHQLVGFLIALLPVGCATPTSAVREDNRRLGATVRELRGERLAQDRRLRALERQVALLRAREAEGVPALPVEVVAPPAGASPAPAAPAPAAPAERVVGVAEDGTEIVYVGDAAAERPAEPSPEAAPGRPRGRGAPAGDAIDAVVGADRPEVVRRAAAPSRAARARPRPEPPGERAAASGDPGADYRAAVALLKNGDPIGATTALRAFLARYPRHDYADNAQYWVGEAYYVQKDFARALSEFRATVETYPRGNKVPDALLKIGYCYVALGQADKARAVLEQVVQLYPSSEPAALAARRLESP